MKKGQVPEPGKSYRIKLPKEHARPIIVRERWIRNLFSRAGISNVPSYAWRRTKLRIPKHIDNVLFVCVGNVARSFTAAQVMKQKVKEQGLNVKVDSVGVSATEGKPGGEIGIGYLKKRGFPEEPLLAHRTKFWMNPKGVELLTRAAQSGIIITAGPGIKQFMQETLRGAESTDWLKQAANAGKRMYTLRGLVTGKDHWTWDPKKTGRLLGLDTHIAPAELWEQSPQETEFLVHELMFVLGPSLARKK